jgi:hypothetical protein
MLHRSARISATANMGHYLKSGWMPGGGNPKSHVRGIDTLDSEDYEKAALSARRPIVVGA